MPPIPSVFQSAPLQILAFQKPGCVEEVGEETVEGKCLHWPSSITWSVVKLHHTFIIKSWNLGKKQSSGKIKRYNLSVKIGFGYRKYRKYRKRDVAIKC